jgi:uncharacterized protein YukE
VGCAAGGGSGEKHVRIGDDDGSDFQVDPAQLTGVAGQLGKAYDDFNTALADYYGAACTADTETVFGDAAVAHAATAFNTAWGSELELYVEALAEMVRNVETTAQRYQETERAVTQGFTGIGAR